MGNSNSISISASAPNIEPTDYHIIGKTSNIRWGEVFEMKNSQINQKVLMHEVFTQDPDTYHNYLEQCSDRLSLFHDNLAGLLGFSPSEIPDPVTNRYSICLYFEHVATSLADLIDARAEALNSAQSRTPNKINSKQYYFDESELMRFLSQLVDVFAYLQMSGINLGDITPDVCFVTETGNIKILDKKFIFDERTTFDLMSQGAAFVFATPGELKALENGFTRCAENRYKADLFRVGMVIVECATLQNSCDVYDWRSQSINIEALSARLIDIKARYSESFYNIVREMLRFDETKRLDFVTLNQRIQDEADTKLSSTMSKSGEQSLKSSQVKAGPAVEPPLTSKGNDISPSNRTPQKEKDVTKNLRDQYMQSMTRERERERRMDKKARKDDDTDDTHEFEDNMKVNTIRLTQQPRLSIGNSQNADNSYEMRSSQINLNKSTLPNFERVSHQESSRRTTPNSSKKETPIKPSPDSLKKGNSMKTTPSKLRIFDPVKSPKALQNIGILSPASRIHEQPRQTTPSKPTEEYAEKMYSPFNHRPSRSDITTPTAEQQQKINYDNLRNFPQLGRYTAGYNTSSAEKPTPTPENRLTNKANTSPEQFAPLMYQTSPSHVKGNPIQFSDQSAYASVPESHRSTVSNVFGTNSVHNELHYIEDPSPQWGYSSAVQPSFGNLEGSFKGSFHNAQPVPVAREDNRGPRGFNVQEDESLRMSFQDRSSLPNFGGHTPADEILVSPAFGMSTSEQLKKSTPKKIDVAQKLEEDKALGVDDRFARAMERSKRSEGFVKEMSRSLSKSPLRKE